MIVLGGHSLRRQVRRRQRIKAAHACMIIPSIVVCLLQEHHLILNLLLLLMVVLLLRGGWCHGRRRGHIPACGRNARCEPQLLSKLGRAAITAALAIAGHVLSGCAYWSAGRVALRAQQGLLALLEPLQICLELTWLA